jgi:hypothetical protein
VQPGVAQHRPQDVDVAGHLTGRQVRQQERLGLATGVGELLQLGQALLDLGSTLRIGVGGRGLVGRCTVDADEGVTGSDAARVEADDVVRGQDARPEGSGGGPGVVEARAAGSARVDQEAAPSAFGRRRRQPVDREVDGAAVEVVVVERHLHGRAREPATAVVPLQPLAGVARQTAAASQQRLVGPAGIGGAGRDGQLADVART